MGSTTETNPILPAAGAHAAANIGSGRRYPAAHARSHCCHHTRAYHAGGQPITNSGSHTDAQHGKQRSPMPGDMHEGRAS